MNSNNRVVARVGARELSPAEMQEVGGAFKTAMACTVIGRSAALDGECALP